jgi:ElaB/YqjD/DUF883 family membrane-anchored ribosome-binding protein
MKTNAYKVIVCVKDIDTMAKTTEQVIDVDAFTAMDAHKEVQDNINWRLQEITEVILVQDKNDENGQQVYSLETGFAE